MQNQNQQQQQHYLQTVYKDDIRSIVCTSFVSRLLFKAILVDLAHLKETNSVLFEKFMADAWGERNKWIQQLNKLQEQYLETMDERVSKDFSVKKDFPVNFFNLPTTKNAKEFNLDIFKLWKPVQIKGKVIRAGNRFKEELYREYKCNMCKKSEIVEASRYERFYFREPKKCREPFCKGNMSTDESKENLDFYIDFQGIKVQTPKLAALPVELESELAESCFVGDEVVIFGTFETRSKHGDISSHEFMLRAMSVIVPENQKKMSKDMDELTFCVGNDWKNELEALGGSVHELQLRDEMVQSVAPELKGLAMMKLSLLLLLVSGGKNTETSKGTTSRTIREIMHLLLIGDPGLGKSQLLKAASEIAANSVRCIGYASTTAGLTAQFFRENNETFIEAGALVKANNGVCCIDEINLMTKEHRGSIHEVMEQQKITMAKAGMLAEIPSKVSIVAGMNKKNVCLPVESSNITIEASLLSRFDVVFELEDPRDPVADLEISMHILNESTRASPSWSLERLKDHVLVAKEVDAKMTVQAEQVLQRYFQFCTRQPAIDQSRNTVRLWNSLNRMTICHAKLVMRSEVRLIDALAVVMLMETTFSMGHLGLKQPSAMGAKYPLGPSNQIAIEILEKLDLEHLLVEEPPRTRNSQPLQTQQELTIDNIDSIFEDSDDDAGAFSASQTQKFSESECELFTQAPATQQSQLDDFPEEESDEDMWNFVPTPQPSTSKQASSSYQQLASSEKSASTSTQQPSTSKQSALTQQPVQPRKSGMLSFFSQYSHPKKIKLTPTVSEKPEASQDSAYSSLNALAANVLKQRSPQSSQQPASSTAASSPAQSSVNPIDPSSTKKNFADKLQKFQYSEGSAAATSTKQEENVLESPQSSENEDDDLDSLTDFKVFD